MTALPRPRRFVLPALLSALLAGCGGLDAQAERPAAPVRAQAAAAQVAAAPEAGARPTRAGIKRYQQVFDERYMLDYQVETRYSSIDQSSCYAFLTGTVTNLAQQPLSRRSTVSFKVYHGGELLFRDFTYLRAHILPGDEAHFEMVESPLHHRQCPSYDRIEATLNPVLLRVAVQ